MDASTSSQLGQPQIGPSPCDEVIRTSCRMNAESVCWDFPCATWISLRPKCYRLVKVLLSGISAVPVCVVDLSLLRVSEGQQLVEGGASLLVSRFRDHPRPCGVALSVWSLGHCGNTADERQSKQFFVQRGLWHPQRDQRQGQRVLGGRSANHS